MSHEIRTPMNAIIGYSNLLLDMPLDDEQFQYAHGIVEAGRGLLTLINDILDLSRLEAGRMPIASERFNMSTLVNGVVDATRVLTRNKPVTVSLHSDLPDNPEFSGDPDRIRQVLLNLAGNAAKFTERGRIDIEVRCAGSSQVEFTIRDTGPGIGEAARERIFAPFEQDRNAQRKRVAGTGLGLSISQRLAELMGGSLSVTSVVGVGSAFHFTVPLAPAAASLVGAAAAPSRRPGVAATGLRCLVAEDTEASRIVIARMLERRGFIVMLAQNGRQAVDIAAATRPDIIFMDVQTPEMDGLEATQRIRQLPGPVSAVPIVALTAQAFASDREMCRKAGMDEFLAKPVLPETLDEALHAALKGARMSAAGQAGSHADPDADVGASGVNASLVARMIEDIGRETTARIVARMTDNAHGLLEKIARGLKAEEADTIRRSTHALSGLLRQAGLEALGTDLQAIETAPDTLDEATLEAINRRLDAGIAELKSLVGQIRNSDASHAA